MKFDPTKPVQTRDGRKARIITTEAHNPTYPIIALVKNKSGVEEPNAFTLDGFFNEGSPGWALDLVNVPTKISLVQYVNVYRHASGRVYAGRLSLSREDAARKSCGNAIACLPVTIEGVEGEGL